MERRDVPKSLDTGERQISVRFNFTKVFRGNRQESSVASCRNPMRHPQHTSYKTIDLTLCHSNEVSERSETS